jgi:hypothetical protein
LELAKSPRPERPGTREQKTKGQGDQKPVIGSFGKRCRVLDAGWVRNVWVTQTYNIETR